MPRDVNRLVIPCQGFGISCQEARKAVDGGLELPLKVVQARMGHSTIQLTADCYGHLFPRGDDSAELAAAESFLV